VTFCSMLGFCVEGLLIQCQFCNLGGPPRVTSPRLIIHCVCSYPLYLKAVFVIHNLSTRHVVMTSSAFRAAEFLVRLKVRSSSVLRFGAVIDFLNF
jgi:hypothetical protein